MLIVTAATTQTGLNATFAQAGKKELIKVNGKSITQDDLERIYKFRNVSRELQPKVRAEFLDILIDSELMQQFLKSQKVTVSPDELAKQVQMVKGLLPKNAAGEVDLKGIGFSEQILREELSLPLKWRNYVMKTVTEEEIQEYFETHKVQFDGTEVRASQIFLAVASMQDPQQVTAALSKLAGIQKEILGGLKFAEAAKKYSDSPTGAKGGDVGWFLYEGKVSPQLAKTAFSLKPGEMSQPFTGVKGVHLCLVTDRKEGQLGLEDARTIVMQAMSNEMWTRKIKSLRAAAQIE
jgi:peptidyl-prolyl cis-trans isomerase C